MGTISFSEPIAGLPPKRDEGTFIGFDADDHPYVLVWNVPADCYSGTGADFGRHEDDTRTPLHFLIREEMADFIVQYVRVLPNSLPASTRM